MFEPNYPSRTDLLRCCRYLAAKSEADHYNRELQREQDEIDTVPDVGKQPPTTSTASFIISHGSLTIISSLSQRLPRSLTSCRSTGWAPRSTAPW